MAVPRYSTKRARTAKPALQNHVSFFLAPFLLESVERNCAKSPKAAKHNVHHPACEPYEWQGSLSES